MNNVAVFLTFTVTIYTSLVIGILLRQKGLMTEAQSGRIMRTTVIFVEPPLICIIFWAIDFSNLRLALAIPGAAALVTTFALLVALPLSRLRGHDARARGAFLGCAMFSNVGMTLGGFVCYLLLGDNGLQIAMLYCSYFIPYFYTIGFFVARSHAAERQTWLQCLKSTFSDWVCITPSLGLLTGIVLSVATGASRPEALAVVQKGALYVTIVLYSLAIGLTTHLGRMRAYLPECLLMCAIKFLALPLAGLAVAWLLHCEGVARQAVFIEACAPVAIFALVLTKLFDLNQDLANACWLFTTFAMLIEVPVILVLVPLVAGPF